ncbi:MAG: hypothetical protein AAGF76_09700 [Pseudomonadota bacterium]
MTTLALSSPRRRLLEDDPRFAGGALVLTLLCAPLLLGLMIDTRDYLGENVWIKPLKFSVSLAVFLATLAWAARYIPARLRESRFFAAYQWIVLFCIAGEMLWIGGAAAFATGSHFNVSTPLMGTLYGLMGIFAVILTSAATTYGALIWRHSSAPEAPAIGLSFIATVIATLIVAGTMAEGLSHHVGVESAGADRQWLMGWSREVGDLRVPHFFATHIMQAVPLAWFAVAAVMVPPKGTGLVLTLLALAVTMATFAQALAGAPFLPGLL